MVSIRSITLLIILSVAILILIHTTFANLSPSYFAQAQNSPTQNITRHISTTMSKEAQEELQKITFDPSLMKFPHPNDLNGWKEQYNNFESIIAQLSQPIVDLYQPNITYTTVGGLHILILNPKTGMIMEKC